ncbi:DUF928 domain-containing protein [Leptolyngbya sp. FACHB-261]|uniref:DUF928 domain-containing protein n=1 Tax=Leptolyngbya sp. FACHB-261 TaxID=2692806 RepID=UPI001682EDF0|nr:DUF928 domain-containing protein [Leptolyngbya sp. FACHB-261]MBD2101717.1 DUF928 domain-containing protein [Leptolyngbya sp. FACHB-261]
MTQPRLPAQLICALGLALASLMLSLAPAQAQTARSLNLFDRIRLLFSQPSSTIGAPAGRRRGGATRDQCPDVGNKALTALVPAADTGLTIAQYPTFWFYVPYSASLQRQAEFVLLDERENDVYKTTFPLVGTPGIVSIRLPEARRPLESGKKYRWVFSVICNPRNRSGDVAVNGWVERVPLSPILRNRLAAATTPLERVSIYLDQKLWYETLTTVVELQRTEPRNTALKAELLRAIGLAELASEPLTSCCTPPEQTSGRQQ